jgi:hypothetical protein
MTTLKIEKNPITRKVIWDFMHGLSDKKEVFHLNTFIK